MQEKLTWPRDSGLKTSSGQHPCMPSMYSSTILPKFETFKLSKKKALGSEAFPSSYPKLTTSYIICFIQSYFLWFAGVGTKVCLPFSYPWETWRYNCILWDTQLVKKILEGPLPKNFPQKTDFEIDKKLTLSYFMPLVSFYTPWIHQKTSDILMFLRVWKETSRLKWVNQVMLFWHLIIFFI